MNRVKRLAGIAALAPLLVTGCDSGAFAPFEAVAGEYQLTVWAARSVPALFNCQPNECEGLPNGGTFAVNDGEIVLHRNGSFREINRYTLTHPNGSVEDVTFSSTGTYTVDEDLINLSAPPQNESGPRFVQATVEFDTISYVENGNSYEYSR